jgi:hypothetical protein
VPLRLVAIRSPAAQHVLSASHFARDVARIAGPWRGESSLRPSPPAAARWLWWATSEAAGSAGVVLLVVPSGMPSVVPLLAAASFSSLGFTSSPRGAFALVGRTTGEPPRQGNRNSPEHGHQQDEQTPSRGPASYRCSAGDWRAPLLARTKHGQTRAETGGAVGGSGGGWSSGAASPSQPGGNHFGQVASPRRAGRPHASAAAADSAATGRNPSFAKPTANKRGAAATSFSNFCV